ncbi:c-di-GMP phosphodiesterase, class II (HD-GYP, GAF domains) [Arcobacter acticola]|jgi:HD-GYP domain-containing protein (c-di-GMP phosphodiesterase class II)/ribonuclease BN (tRNA processing enzyme)|uniref:C-di-GMP phosphodiesterase, class II (HD-GYP, GAF domains) n=1 Tax=Arcobacter acticola TaxID=1849015 RepID=A0A6M8EUZ9_9BACT|nr:HD domain-containing phosphohydrolase [Arcobacter acticola]QKE28355.1 c-di-GMP phosphodiesterase, class II (HD-GYP, GAF domains) [Arcobacter acticola]
MNYIKILGASGSKAKDLNTTSFQIYKDIVIDAGNVLNALGDEAKDINHVFLTHSHADHITDLPFIIETFFENRETPLTIYALEETIEVLKKHSFNDVIWPDFTKIKLLRKDAFSLILKPIKLDEIIKIHNYSIKAIKANHISGACGFVIKKNHQGFVISGDTHINPHIWEEINNDEEIRSLIIECSYPDKLQELAKLTKHLTPELIANELEKLTRKNLSVFYYHLKPSYNKELLKDIKKHKLLTYNGKILKEGDVIHIETGSIESTVLSEHKFEEIMKINLAFSSQHDKNILLEDILTLTRNLTNADAGTLYIKSKDEKYLSFKVVHNNTLNIKMGGTKNNLNWPDLPIFEENGKTNNEMVAVVCANEKRIINIPDVYKTTKYQFDGTKDFDKSTSYHSKSMLVIPLINHDNEVIGVLQLINKIKNGEIINFNKLDEKVIISLASQAAMALTNMQLITSLEDFIDAFVTTIAKAIDTKSPYTSDHIGKVEEIALLVAKAISDDNTIYKKIKYSENDYKQLSLAAWMHDIGKISMPEHIIDKATKLEKIFDRIHLIEQRFEVIKLNKEIEYLKNQTPRTEYENFTNEINNDIEFIKRINFGGEFMSDEDIQKLENISRKVYIKNDGEIISFISEDEFYNLSIKKGTLTKEEIEIIRNHAKLSLDMISGLPFPKKYKDVLNIACNHHEKLNGLGYPRGLKAEEISLEDRIMILADIFEALTASARPYKDAMKLSKVKDILSSMANKGELDKELIDFFFNHKILHEYSKNELKSYQLDLE